LGFFFAVLVTMRAMIAVAFWIMGLLLPHLGFADTPSKPDVRVRLIGSPGASVEIYRVTEDGGDPNVLDKRQLLPLGAIVSGRIYGFPSGRYFAVNQCSSLFFELVQGSQKDLHLRRLVFERMRKATIKRDERLVLGQQPPAASTLWSDFVAAEEGDAVRSAWTLADRATSAAPLAEVIPVECTHPLTGVRQMWREKDSFELLMGQVSLAIAGRPWDPAMAETGDKTKDPNTQIQDGARKDEVVPVMPVLVRAADTASTDYFVSWRPQEGAPSNAVVAAPVGSLLWLVQGRYAFELNGSQRQVSVQVGSGVAIGLGSLEVTTPKDFPMAERIKIGGSPPFVYVNGDVLFTLDTPYLVFPGRYRVTLEGGDVTAFVDVHSGEATRLRTLGARVSWPRCDVGESVRCKSPSVITLHAKQRPFVLGTVDAGTPFLVFEGEYEYGVEGLRGVLRRLKASHQGIQEETLARLRISYRVQRAAPKVRTDLLRLESQGDSLFGKSLDLLFQQPEEVVAPPGSYELTYFVGDPAGERTKVKRNLELASGSTSKIVVPIHSDKAAPSSLGSQAQKPAAEDMESGTEESTEGAAVQDESIDNQDAPNPSQATPTPASDRQNSLPTKLKPLRK
jgi:hypothetical protein